MNPGNRSKIARISSIEPLVESDMEFLREKSERPRLDKLRDSHHFVARYTAWGWTREAIARSTGFSLSRISALCADPSVQELISHYRTQRDQTLDEKFDHYAEAATANMMKAERRLADKLDDDDLDISVRDLVAIAADRADRFGYGKKNMNLNLNVDFAAKLDAAIARTKKVAIE